MASPNVNIDCEKLADFRCELTNDIVSGNHNHMSYPYTCFYDKSTRIIVYINLIAM